MKLSYRGAHYEYNQPTLEVTEGEILGRYRGANWRCHTLQEMPILQPGQPLKYRGTAYRSGEQPGLCPVDVAQSAIVRCQIPCTTAPIRKEVSRVHRANLERNLEYRLQVAKQKGNQVLIDLLEAERSQLA
jgi:hypothetical protein